jgi:hypothetical protein
MMSCEKLKEEYLNEMNALMDGWKKSSESLRAEERFDEAVLEDIKVNIADIFYKMFTLSFNNSCKGTDSQVNELGKLKDMYLAFFNKIPASWKVKLQKDKEYNMMEEYYKEEIKLETADKVKSLFLEYYEKAGKVEN